MKQFCEAQTVNRHEKILDNVIGDGDLDLWL